MGDPIDNLAHTFDRMPDDLKESIDHWPDGEVRCKCGMLLPAFTSVNSYDCDCGRAWVYNPGDNPVNVPILCDEVHVEPADDSSLDYVYRVPPDGFVHVADVEPAEWAKVLPGRLKWRRDA